MVDFFDFCAGIGAAHLAFKNLGGRCVGYSEIDTKAIQTYQLFFGTHHKNYGDVMRIIPKSLPDFDILLVGFPCQAFSIVGKRGGFDDIRGQIIYGLRDIIKLKQPKAFLLENVKGLVNIHQGQTLKEIVTLLQETGYHVFYKVLDSLHFGVSQSRERIYFVGIRHDIYHGEFEFPTAVENHKNIQDFLIDRDERFIITSNVYETFLRYLDNKYNKDKFILSDLLSENYLVLDTRQSDLRLYRGKIPTLRTGRQGIFYVKDGTIRKLSGLEALLLQGFDYELALKAQNHLPQSSILAEAGNAMTVNVMQSIGENILYYLKQDNALQKKVA